MRKRWEEALSISLNDVDSLCDAHFQNEDFETHFEIKLTDESIHRIPREKIALKQNAIPMKVFY